MAEQWLPVYISLLTPIATFAVVLVGFLYHNSRFTELSTSVDRRLSEFGRGVDARITELSKSVQARITELSKSVDAWIAGLDNRISELSKTVDSRITDLKDLIKAQGTRFEADLARVESSLLTKFAELDTRLTRIESRIP